MYKLVVLIFLIALPSQIYANNKITVLAASDVSQKSIDITTDWLSIAEKEWFKKENPASKRFYPILLVLVGADMDAAIELEKRLCSEIKERFADKYDQAFAHCTPRPDCKFGLCYITEYVNGGAAIASSRIQQGFHLMIMSSKYPGPRDHDYGMIVIHEAYHIYQSSHITERDHDLFEKKMGGRSGDHNREVPWWIEGTADYMSRLLFSRQSGVDSKYLTNHMRDILCHNVSGCPNPVKAYLKKGGKLYNYGYNEEGHQAIDTIAPWFVAYIIHNFGEESMSTFYRDLDILGFEASFQKHFEKPYREVILDFNKFIKKPVKN